MTALVIAARENAQATVRALIERGADLNQTSANGTTPLVAAILNGHNDLASYLLDEGADPNIYNLDVWSALYLAVWNRNYRHGTDSSSDLQPRRSPSS